ncbi:MAG: epoxyqueuosine reductase QueH [Clostridia bacterium]|nr:epoxyqueuosine reductase QueH [Clostridia bacterium]
MAEKVLLHSCCGPCSTACIERLIDDFELTVLYYNPCIDDEAEYELRKANQIKFINEYGRGVSFMEGEYDPDRYHALVKGYEDEPEGGARCTICFEMRLRQAAKIAKEKGFDYFATTLTVSPHKNYDLISRLGNQIQEEVGVKFLDVDFKKKAGFQRSTQMSKEYGLYRQNYCGCNFSKRG